MPAFIVTAPDGKKYRVNTPEGASSDDAIAYLHQSLGPQAQEAPEEAGFFNTAVESAKSIFRTPAALSFAGAAPEEQDALRKKFLEQQSSNLQGVSWEDVDNLPEFWQWLKQTAGGSLGSIVVPGALAGAAQLSKVTNPYAKAVGYGAMGLQYLTENLGRQAGSQEAAIERGEAPEETSLASAAVAAAGQTALDVPQYAWIFGKLAKKFPGLSAIAGETEEVAQKNLPVLVDALKRGDLKMSNGLLKGAIGGAAFEIPQEIAQTALERWQAGLSLTDEEAKKEYIESAVGAGILGGGMGAAETALGNRADITAARNEIINQEEALRSAEVARQEEEKARREAAEEIVKAQKEADEAAMAGVEKGEVKEKAKEVTPIESYLPEATEIVRALAAKNNGVEAVENEWYDALTQAFNLRPGEASPLIKAMKDSKVIGFRKPGDKLNRLYTPSITEQREELIKTLTPEIERVTAVANPNDKAQIQSILSKLQVTTEEGKKPRRLTKDKFEEFTTSLNQVLTKYPVGAAPAVAAPAVAAPAVAAPAVAAPAVAAPLPESVKAGMELGDVVGQQAQNDTIAPAINDLRMDVEAVKGRANEADLGILADVTDKLDELTSTGTATEEQIAPLTAVVKSIADRYPTLGKAAWMNRPLEKFTPAKVEEKEKPVSGALTQEEALGTEKPVPRFVAQDVVGKVLSSADKATGRLPAAPELATTMGVSYPEAVSILRTMHKMEMLVADDKGLRVPKTEAVAPKSAEGQSHKDVILDMFNTRIKEANEGAFKVYDEAAKATGLKKNDVRALLAEMASEDGPLIAYKKGNGISYKLRSAPVVEAAPAAVTEAAPAPAVEATPVATLPEPEMPSDSFKTELDLSRRMRNLVKANVIPEQSRVAFLSNLTSSQSKTAQYYDNMRRAVEYLEKIKNYVDSNILTKSEANKLANEAETFIGSVEPLPNAVANLDAKFKKAFEERKSQVGVDEDISEEKAVEEGQLENENITEEDFSRMALELMRKQNVIKDEKQKREEAEVAAALANIKAREKEIKKTRKEEAEAVGEEVNEEDEAREISGRDLGFGTRDVRYAEFEARSQQALPPNPKYAAADAALRGKDVDTALQWAMDNTKNMALRAILARTRRKMEAMRKDGISFTFEVVDGADYNRVFDKNKKGGYVYGLTTTDGDQIKIQIPGANAKVSGLIPSIITHELVHAVTTASYKIGKLFPKTNPELKQAADDLDRLLAHVREQAKMLSAAGKLTPAELEVLEKTNFLKDSYELISYGLSDKHAQSLLDKISYTEYNRGRKISAWDWFVGHIRDLLGMSRAADTALSEVLRASNVLITTATDRALPSGEATVSAAATTPGTNTQRVWVAPQPRDETHDDRVNRLSKQEGVRIDPRKGLKQTFDNLTTTGNWETLIKNFQNEGRPMQTLSERIEAAGLLEVIGDKKNDLWGEKTRSMALAENAMATYMWPHMVDIEKGINEWSDATKESKDRILAKLQTYVVARHERERREALFYMTVPMNTKTETSLDSKLVSTIMIQPRGADGKVIAKAAAVPLSSIKAPAATLRAIIKNEIDQNKDLVSNGYAEKMYAALKELAKRNNNQFLDNSVDGFTPAEGLNVQAMSLNIDDPLYNVVGPYTQKQIAEDLAAYEAAKKDPKTGAALKKVLDAMQKLQDASIVVDKKNNYWSNPVSNRKAFYGWKHYVPLKGQGESALAGSLEELDFSGERLGAGFNDTQNEFGGRATDADNPLLRVMVDATKSSLRYGRHGMMESLANLIEKNPKTGTQFIKGKGPKNIKFEDRYRMAGNTDYTGQDKFYVYRNDGSIDIYTVNDRVMLEAIRRTFREPNRLIDMANSLTSALGHLHTRYNIAFHPYNFVRDALTNAFTLGAEFGPKQSVELIKAVASRVAQSNMMSNAGKISLLYKEGKIAEIERMARGGDKFAKDALEFLNRGGRVTNVYGTDIRAQGESLMKDVKRSKGAQMKDAVDYYVDVWADSFELTSRVATYGVLKNLYLAKGMSEQAASIKAANYAKNLANFEQVGKYGREAGAIFMFFRPAATGAVRAIDALMPAFQSWESHVKTIPEGLRGPEELAKAKKAFDARKDTAQAMIYGLIGAGAALYTMAFMAADDDDFGRNKVATDKMALWTRNLRLPLSVLGIEKFKDDYLQVPWGFGLGAFGAIGAQVAGVAMGKTTMGEAIPNLITIGLDSYVPVPFSRVDPTENFAAWAATSFMPSAARPAIEYAMNVDSLGREIYNDRQSRYGDSFTGGRNTPQLWKDAARMLFNISGGELDVSPDTMLFFANNYADGYNRIAQSGYGLFLAGGGDKNFSVKEDFAPLSSFIGRASSYDGEKFANLKKEMEEIGQRMKVLERDPELREEYFQRHPTYYYAYKVYSKQSNGMLRKLQQMRNAIEASDDTPKVKEEKLKQVYLAINGTKRAMIERAKSEGIEF